MSCIATSSRAVAVNRQTSSQRATPSTIPLDVPRTQLTADGAWTSSRMKYWSHSLYVQVSAVQRGHPRFAAPSRTRGEFECLLLCDPECNCTTTNASSLDARLE